jgi:Zn-dependent protease
LETLLSVLKDKNLFAVTATEPIDGGYIVRGAINNKSTTASELVDALDNKLPMQWSAQACYLQDLFAFEGDPILVLLNKDMAPTTSRWILSFTTAAAIVSAFAFCVGTYGFNDVVVDRMRAATDLGDRTGVAWFNGKVFEIILPLLAVQGVHELGHFAIAARDKLQIAPPTLLPFWSLPIMGAQTQLKESPKNLTSLFDFAIVGPVFGILISLALLCFGLQETASLTADAQYFPALPVSVIRASTLGGSIVDHFLGDITSLQDLKAPVPMHPLALAGFTSLIIQCVDLLPLGRTDGGRLSLALFGRKGHSLLGGACWTLLLLASLFLKNSDILVGAWVVNNIAQNDPEVPCRDEVANVDIVRGLFAMGLWFFAILVLVPMQ